MHPEQSVTAKNAQPKDSTGADKKAMQVDDILGTFNEISIECGN